MNLVTVLAHLQSLDYEIANQSKRGHQIDEAIAGDPAVVAARAALDAEQKRLHDLTSQLRDRELEAKGLDQKIKELNDRLYGGRITNPKELDGYAKDLEMHKRNRSLLDDKLLELMDAVDQTKKRVDEQSLAFKQIEDKRASELEHLTRERESLTTRLTQLAAEREATRASIAAEVLRTYDKLLLTKAGRAVAQLKREACGVCGVGVPTGLINRVRTGEEMIFCSSCGRILAP
jgi:hypothetical protein